MIPIYPESPHRLEAFANFFKGYTSISALLTAVLPIPVAAFGLIPSYQFQTRLLGSLTSLFCFLILAFVFYSRHQLARFMFPRYVQRYSGFAMFSRSLVRVLPLGLMAGSLFCMFRYLSVLIQSVSVHRQEWGLTEQVTDSAILSISYQSQVPEATILMTYYLAFFMTAVAAFTLMALKEYLQELLGLTEIEVITRPTR